MRLQYLLWGRMRSLSTNELMTGEDSGGRMVHNGGGDADRAGLQFKDAALGFRAGVSLVFQADRAVSEVSPTKRLYLMRSSTYSERYFLFHRWSLFCTCRFLNSSSAYKSGLPLPLSIRSLKATTSIPPLCWMSNTSDFRIFSLNPLLGVPLLSAAVEGEREQFRQC